jgi:hypothetical protein
VCVEKISMCPLNRRHVLIVNDWPARMKDDANSWPRKDENTV